MKKFLLICLIVLASQGLAFADEIINESGTTIQCKIITVGDGLFEYKKDGFIYSFHRASSENLFPDYVDARTKLFSKNSIKRYTGKIIVKDAQGVRIRTSDGDIQIPWYKVHFIGVFKPN